MLAIIKQPEFGIRKVELPGCRDAEFFNGILTNQQTFLLLSLIFSASRCLGGGKILNPDSG
jgi:hypothetical protein